jgi:sugar lactone lactonase YvrE
MRSTSSVAIGLCLVLLGTGARRLAGADGLPTKEDPRVTPMFSSSRVWNGVAISSNGLAFACYTQSEGPGLQVGEIAPQDKPAPWPDVAWNSWKPGRDLTNAFVHVNALRFGPDGRLWVVDGGAPGIGKPRVPKAARLFAFDLDTGRLVQSFSFEAVTKPKTFIDDVRFNGDHAYLTDAGAPGLIVLDLKSGAMRRVLDSDKSTTDLRTMIADGQVMKDEKGQEVRVHADQLEVSPDGMYFYYQPASGPLARIETKYLDDASLSDAELAKHVEANWVNTPTSGGTAIDAKGNIYMGDAEHRRIIRIAPDKTVTVVAEDPRFIWTDAMWIDAQDNLWIPAAQLNRTKGMNGGHNAVKYPVWIYKLPIDAGPPALDHN